MQYSRTKWIGVVSWGFAFAFALVQHSIRGGFLSVLLGPPLLLPQLLGRTLALIVCLGGCGRGIQLHRRLERMLLLPAGTLVLAVTASARLPLPTRGIELASAFQFCGKAIKVFVPLVPLLWLSESQLIQWVILVS